jgi:REP element-mobilizing transposase RayT
MSNSRPTYPGTTYLVTRRCSERRFFLQPDALVFQVFAFLVAVAADKFNIQVHAVCVMGNHWHVALTDTDGLVPKFCHYVHEFSSKCLNASRGRWEAMWSIEETNRVSLEDLDAVVDKVGYTLLNPVSAGLVERAEQWTGLRMWWGDAPITVARPPVFFSPKGKVAKSATLELVPPPQLAAVDADGGVARMTAHLAEREAQLRAEIGAFLGMDAVNDQKWWESPTTFAKRRGLQPRVATRNKWRRIEALQRDKHFLAAYREARDLWLTGDRNVIWPYGTYGMRVFHEVRCAPPPELAAA